MPYMYILKCADESYYTGSTWNLEKRLAEHQSGVGAKHTAKRLPVTLVYCEECDRIEDAFFREKQVQGWGRRKKQALIAGDTNALHRLAECRNETHHGFGSAQPPTAQPPTAQPPTAQPPTAQPPTAQSPTAQSPTAQSPSVQSPDDSSAQNLDRSATS